MPQMAPMNWLSLMIFFIIIFFMFNSLNYFSLIYKPKSTKFSSKKIQLFWKW
uniref:ATP synthase complex subunit 8 n=1 Tax=Osphya bipunctata TaxID=1227470 RepID=S4SUQ9_9CUCU|nr:ATP synthase F0 subunit 8 [Osphya bipunctata]